jgi:hypothetical protein
MNKQVEILKDNEVILSITEKNFADIILNFLGNKQILSFTAEENFNITLNDLEQFYYLLDEKIQKENYTNIDYFSVTISYHDKTTREITGINALKSYLETRDVSPISIVLTWNIVLKFPNSQTIENQKIEVLFSFDEEYSDISLKIEHTNQAWGIEILNLLKDHIQSFLIYKPKTLKIAEEIHSLINIHNMVSILLLITMTIFIFSVSNIQSEKDDKERIKAKHVSKLMNIGISENKIAETLFASYIIDKDYKNPILLNNFTSLKLKKELERFIQIKDKKQNKILNKENSILFLIVGIFAGVAMFTKQTINYYGTKSFIVITRRSEKDYENFKNEKSKVQYFSLALIGFSIICSVIANIIYQFFFI